MHRVNMSVRRIRPGSVRIALERSTQIAPRIQIAVERLKLQQEQVARVDRQLDDVRRELDKSRTEQQKRSSKGLGPSTMKPPKPPVRKNGRISMMR